MSKMTARERTKNINAMVTAIIDDDMVLAESLLKKQVDQHIKYGKMESEEELSKWYRDGVEETKEAINNEPPKKRWWHGIGFH